MRPPIIVIPWTSRRRTFALLLVVSASLLSSCLSPEERASRNAVSIFVDDGPIAVGSGVMVAPGQILTCLHVVRMSRAKIEVKAGDERKRASILHENAAVDLVLLAVDSSADFPRVKWVDRGDLKAGIPVFLIGAPYGLENSILRGSVSHIGRKGVDSSFSLIPFIQTQGISFPGTSGAAVYRENGDAIGINRATYGLAPGTGIGLTIPGGVIQAFLKEAGITYK